MATFQFENQDIGLALSGGGVRAAVFHAGVLKWVSERNCLSRVAHISSVSGGSLFTGLVFKLSDYTWPSSSQYLEEVYPQIRELFTTKSLQANTLLRLFLDPTCWRFIVRRAQVISRSIESLWGIKASLGQLPDRPTWTINGTTAENGLRFRFLGTSMGDYKFGYAEAKDYKLSTAMAVSAAFPGGIGPVRLNTTAYQWRNIKSRNSEITEAVSPAFNEIHLYDGGVYDNLGLEALFDIGSQDIKSIKKSYPTFLIVSDAGAIHGNNPLPGPLSPKRLKRVADVAFDQCRALRVRAYVNFIMQNPDKGMYAHIGSDPHAHVKKNDERGNRYAWLSPEERKEAATYPTTLKKMKIEAFDNIARHGYETALAKEMAYLQ